MANESSSMSYSGTAITGVAGTLETALQTFETQVNLITATIDSMSGYWGGEAYQAFKTETDKYRETELDPMVTELKTWVEKLKALGEAATKAQTDNTNLFGNGS